MNLLSADLEEVPFPEIGRPLYARPGTTDRRTIDDARTGRYHLPPDSMPTPATVLDLGANIGATVAHYQHLWPDAEVVAVEMDAGSAALIGLNAPGVTVRQHAVSAYGGWGSYSPAGDEDAFRFRQGTHEDGDLTTMSHSLRQIVLRAFEHPPRGPARPVDFVKMDVEGAEWEILHRPNYWAGLVRHLLVELHPPDGQEWDDSLLNLASARLEVGGFRAERHAPHPRAVWAWWP